MRILKVTQSYAPFFEFGGPPVKVCALAEGLARRGHAVTVVTADWGVERRLHELGMSGRAERAPFGQRWKKNGVTADYLTNRGHFRALSWNPGLRRYLQSIQYEVAHIFGLYDLLGPRVAAECRERGIPYVVEPIGMFVPIVRNIRLKQIYHRVWGREMLEGAGAIIATAEQERDELVAGGLPASKIVLRRNGVEAPAQLPDGKEFRRELGISDNTKLLLFLGRLSQKKSPELLLKSFAGLQSEGNIGDVQLAFVGPDESGMKSRLEEMATGLRVAEKIHFAGPLDGQAKWKAYRAAQIFVLPSQNENFGNSAAEAVAAGIPVVVSDQCGIAPLLKDLAAVVVRHDERDLRDGLKRLLVDSHLYENLRAGCAKVMEGLGWEQPVHEMELIYSRLAGPLRS